MKTAIRFQKTVKHFHGSPAVHIDDLQIYDGECVAFYGLADQTAETIANQITGAISPETGSVYLYGTDTQHISDKKWFDSVGHFGIYNRAIPLHENASVGENIARLFRFQKEPVEEPQLSSAVLNVANLVQLTITDLSRIVYEAGSLLKMKLRLARALAFRPDLVIFFEPTEELTQDVSKKFVDLVRKTRRKHKYTLVLFTSDIRFMQELADRVFFLNPASGVVIENQLREWYHTLLPFLQPSPAKLLNLARNILQYGGVSVKRVQG